MTLVIGSGGQLGFELQRILDGPAQYVDREEFNLEKPEEFTRILRELKPKYVINAAAYTAVDKAESERDLAFAINSVAPARLADLAVDLNFKFIHVSTDYVFNGQANRPVKEDEPIEPLGVYGASKAAGEAEIMKRNPHSLIVRTSWLYSTHGQNFVKTVLRLSKERPMMGVVNDQIGSLTSARDLAAALLAAKDGAGIFHYSNEGVCSWYDVACAIKRFKNFNMEIKPISTSEYPTPARRPAFSLLDKTKIKTSFNLKIPHWMESLESCLKELS